ncbi:MAG: serpin family protein [Polyangiaceae bacterium]
MKTTSFLLGSLALTLAFAAGCDGSSSSGECTDADKPGCVVESSKQRIQNPDVPAADTAELVKGNSKFAFDLYQQLRAEQGNLFYSPYSISLALAMTWAGAKGKTESDMAATLGFTLPQDKLHPAFNGLDQALASRGKNAKASDGMGFRLKIANALWGQVGFPFEQPFLDTLAVNYGAGMHIVDYETDPAGSVDLINNWIDTQTEGKIPKLLSPDNIDSSTRLILTNAIYFNAAWQTPFEEKDTKSGAFTKVDGSTENVDMMHLYLETGFAQDATYKATVLPYDGGELSMVVVMPEVGTLDTFESTLDATRVGEIVDGVTKSEYGVDLTFPKFKFDAQFGLKKALTSMGMGIAFDGADLSGISSKGNLVIQDVIHKAFVNVNEAGTEAAAATAVIAGETSAPEPATMLIDHPFLFLIRDNATGSILFVGRVEDPAAQ